MQLSVLELPTWKRFEQLKWKLIGNGGRWWLLAKKFHWIDTYGINIDFILGTVAGPIVFIGIYFGFECEGFLIAPSRSINDTHMHPTNPLAVIDNIHCYKGNVILSWIECFDSANGILIIIVSFAQCIHRQYNENDNDSVSQS